MAHNFKINIHPTIDNLYIRLMGDFDGSSAFELINAIKGNLKNSKYVKIDTRKLKKVYPFGQEVFNQNWSNVKDMQIEIEFVGPNALQIPQPDDNLMTAEQP